VTVSNTVTFMVIISLRYSCTSNFVSAIADKCLAHAMKENIRVEKAFVYAQSIINSMQNILLPIVNIYAKYFQAK
jgi:hypothetical protein